MHITQNSKLNIENYHLLALDLDGTIVPHDLIIRPAVREAIAAAQDAGVIVALATGRMFRATLFFAEQLGIAGPLICYQGGMVRHATTGETSIHHLMPNDVAVEAMRLLHEHDTFFIAYVEERMHLIEHRPEFDTYLAMHPEGAEIVLTPDLVEQAATLPITKILLCAEPDIVTERLAMVRERLGARIASVRSHAIFGELMPLGVNKGRTLAELAAQLGIPREKVIAVGDQENDIQMLEWAGLGLAMGNAVPAVKAAADAVIPSIDEDGVAWAIHHYIFDSVTG